MHVCLCVFVCIHVYLCVCMHVYLCTSVCVCMCPVCLCMCVHACVPMCVCMHVSCVPMCVYMCPMCTYAYVQVTAGQKRGIGSPGAGVTGCEPLEFSAGHRLSSSKEQPALLSLCSHPGFLDKCNFTGGNSVQWGSFP